MSLNWEAAREASKIPATIAMFMASISAVSLAIGYESTPEGQDLFHSYFTDHEQTNLGMHFAVPFSVMFGLGSVVHSLAAVTLGLGGLFRPKA